MNTRNRNSTSLQPGDDDEDWDDDLPWEEDEDQDEMPTPGDKKSETKDGPHNGWGAGFKYVPGDPFW